MGIPRGGRRTWAAIPEPTRRESHRVKVAAITGSNGKTTTKEITAGILGRRFRILNNEGNLNNLIGLLLSLLKPWKVHEIAVREMGMNAPGEIRRLKAIADPQVSLITKVGRAHLEFLGSLEGVEEVLAPGDWILIKGSRRMRMERVVEGLKSRRGRT